MLRSFLFVALCLVAGLLAWQFLAAEEEPVALGNARAEVAMTGDALHVFVDVTNPAGPDRLVGASSPEARSAVIVSRAGTEALPIPAGSTPQLSADGAYLRLEGVEGALEEGRLVPIALTFERSGTLSTQALVGAPADPHAMLRAMGMMTAMVGPPLADVPPTLAIVVTPAEDGGWAVALTTGNFVFDPEVEKPAHVAGHGHGHLYLDGLKLQRLYGATARIGALAPGDYTVLVSLNTNTHEVYLGSDGPVMAEATITVRD